MMGSILKTDSLPDTRYKIDQMFSSKEDLEFHSICPYCKRYAGIFNENDRFKLCPVCHKTINLKSPSYYDFFVIINIEKHLKNLLEKNFDYFMAVMNNIKNKKSDDIKDFTDGKLYKEFVDNLPDHIKLFATAIFNTDGSPAFSNSNSKFSIWPIQLLINELPIYVRLLNPLLCGLWFGKVKPDMNIFLKPFVDKINKFASTGISLNIRGAKLTIPFFVICCCVDSGARYQMQGIVQYNGRYGCSWCLHEGNHVLSGKGGCIKYTLTGNIPPPRTKEGMFQHMEQSLTSPNPVFGVRNPSCLINMFFFNIPSGFVPCSLHLMGVAKQFFGYWFDSTRKLYSLNTEDIKLIDEYIKKVKVPKKVTRITRSISERKLWTAREWENWTMYYSIPILLHFPKMLDYAIHWAKFVEAYFILNKDNIRPDELTAAHTLLLEFQCYAQYYYTESSMSYNVHLLKHLTQSVVDWGPLWAHTGYCFENGNGVLKKKIHAAKGVISQVCRSVCMEYCETILRENLPDIVEDDDDSYLQNFIDHLDEKSNLPTTTVKIDSARFFGNTTSVRQKWLNELKLSSRSQCYSTMIKGKCRYESYNQSSLQYDNSHAILTDGTMIRISKFIVDTENLTAFVIYKKIHVRNLLTANLNIKEVVDISKKKYYVEARNVDKICVFMNVFGNQYISSVPNLFNF